MTLSHVYIPLTIFLMAQFCLTLEMVHNRKIDFVELLLAHIIFLTCLAIAILMVLCYDTWRERNRRVFNKRKENDYPTYEYFDDSLEDLAGILNSRKAADFSDDEDLLYSCPCGKPNSKCALL